MKFTDEKKRSVMLYILEKVAAGEESLSKVVSEACDINQNTVHTYIKQLLADNIIQRKKRGIYELVTQEFVYTLNRTKGEIESDTYAFDKYFKDHIKGLPQNVFDIWAYTLSEMMNNVMDHSEAEEATLIVLQNYLYTSVFIKDNGIGIFKKIKEHFGYDSLDEAIAELFKGKLTTDAENHSGEGIFFSSKMVDEFFILSDGKIFTNNKYDMSATITYANEKFEPQGTMVYMSLSNFSNKNILEVFDRYSNLDNGFDKTTIPLKNMFETAPVSRSQAKRVCNRLNEFREVILDFEGLEWMGQGFAHQIFVVFQNAHPDIVLTPVNMSDGVNKMYNHVVNG